MFTIRMTTCIIYTIFNKTPRTVYFWNNSMQNQLDTHAITEVYLCHITRFEIYDGLQTRYASYKMKHTTVPANLRFDGLPDIVPCIVGMDGKVNSFWRT